MKLWLIQHYYALSESLYYGRHEKSSFFFNSCNIAILLSLLFFIAIIFPSFLPNLSAYKLEPELTLFLENGVNPVEFKRQLQQQFPEEKITLFNKKAALDSIADDRIVKEVLSIIDENPLPDTIIMNLKQRSSSYVKGVKEKIALIPGVVTFYTNDQANREINYLFSLAGYIGMAIFTVITAIVFITTFNFIRLLQVGFRHKIQISLWLGAAPRFVRRPFYYQGVWMGILSGFFACILSLVMVRGLVYFLLRIKEVYGFTFVFSPPGLGDYVALFLFAILISWLSAVISSRFFRVGKLSRES